MPKISVTLPHRLTPSQALGRIKNLLAQVKAEHADKLSNVNEHWNGNTGTFSMRAMGFNVSGTLVVQNESVVINGDLPFAASLFKGKIESTLRQKGAELLA